MNFQQSKKQLETWNRIAQNKHTSPLQAKREVNYSMGLIRGEGIILRNKYMKKFGLSQYEATDKVSDFIDEINLIRDQMKVKKKSEVEIKLKLQTRFEEEFQKLCCE